MPHDESKFCFAVGDGGDRVEVFQGPTYGPNNPPPTVQALEDMMPPAFREFLAAARVEHSAARILGLCFLTEQVELDLEAKRGFLMWCELASNAPDIARGLID